MNNADLPAMPSDVTYVDECENVIRNTYTGLTKLEHFTCAAMQGLLANGMTSTSDFTILAKQAVRMARNQLTELGKVE